MRMPSDECASIRELFSLSLDEELEPLKALQLERHLAGCAACRQRTVQMEMATDALRAAVLEPAPMFVMRTPASRRPLRRTAIPVAAAFAILSLGFGLLQGSAHLGSGRSVQVNPATADSGEAESAYAIPPQPQQPYSSAVLDWAP